jgi:hypothetical protein
MPYCLGLQVATTKWNDLHRPWARLTAITAFWNASASVTRNMRPERRAPEVQLFRQYYKRSQWINTETHSSMYQ